MSDFVEINFKDKLRRLRIKEQYPQISVLETWDVYSYPDFNPHWASRHRNKMFNHYKFSKFEIKKAFIVAANILAANILSN
ncbi:hypothetical protein Sjap_015188 [Stephania japonica]|uniref:Uncharacterized protein n=1 Tax=Stephania japonica TaxID=461633 RepID=A0AAP0IIM8_9MAGN